MNSPTRRQSCSGGRGGGGGATASICCCCMRSISDAATHDGMDSCGSTAWRKGGGVLNASGGIGVRCPWNGAQFTPSKRQRPSSEIALFHFEPSQNQLPSADQPVCWVPIKAGKIHRGHGN